MPPAPAFEMQPVRGRVWRVVEAQHLVSTLKLVDNLQEQALLEAVLERSKPQVPPECAGLDYLLATPFRYRAVGHGSRFRRAGPGPGVFYGAEALGTALAENAFWRLMFFADSPRTPWPANALEHTAFAVRFATAAAVDLTVPPLGDRGAEWMRMQDYSACQDLADAVRAAGGEAIRYLSVRDPGQGANWALLTCRAFAARRPEARESWKLHLSAHGVAAISDFPRSRMAFGREAFAADPRMQGFAWDRPRVSR